MGIGVDCICDPTEKGGYKYVQWIGSVFGDCIYTPLEKFSYYSGVISIVFYFIAFYPQIYENYKRKSTDGLSLVLIIIWLFGDLSNYIGTILTEQYPIQKIVGIYFALMEVLIIGQYLYYKFFYKGPGVIEEEEDDDQEANEYDQLIVKTEGGEPQDGKTRQASSPQHTYETFSDIQKSPIHPPLDPVEAIDATPKANINNIASSPVDVTEPTATNTNTNTTTDTTTTTNNNNGTGSLSSSIISKSSKRSFLENENIEVIAEPKPEPQEVSKPETKYETFDEISQKQQEAQSQAEEIHQVHDEEAPIYNITSNINTDTNAQSYSASISSSLSKANMRNIKNDSQESLTNKEEDDGEDSKGSSEEIYESSSKEASSLSLDTKDGEDDDEDDDDNDNENENEDEGEGEGGLNRSESSLNKRRKKKGKKGKKKKGKKPKRGKGLSTVIQTIALLSLFIIQVQARAFNWPESYNSRRLLETRDEEEAIRICDESPNLSMVQKVLGSFMAWGSGLLYFTCRIPQILENKRNRSVEGLSIFLFLSTILGNLFYGLSIMTRFPPIDEKFFAGTLPYLIGSVGTFIFDIIIIYQFNAYKYSSSSEQGYQHLE